MQVSFYQSDDGTIPIQKFLSKNRAAIGRVMAIEERLKEGHTSSIKWLTGRPGIGEYRVNTGAGLRVYLMRDGDELIILLCAGFKDSQEKDIEQAQKYRDAYLKAKGGK
ncbi:type II toxin-antitoxin system RelE/ParE family toxin [Hafnia alvei]|uniref:type II toxin-antitoxin system RelE/ParE family toxin n=1 Tax=Hafnia alvei TaxID=569 RepID=UPI0010351C6C|nr:type II toxin-antitoxin system RelE/ParE family toxin [Hafnia alvei]KAA0263843.1 type II toxin-antitoxin system RelE/ParE family toxin [Hafnia alvei]MCE9872681.1 hypothetical protein [Hafnia alvei]TBL41328.1 type II toxin-antitoxin system RelE/ParE family toxin [Hafnia alvei]